MFKSIRHVRSSDLENWLSLRRSLWADTATSEHRQDIAKILSNPEKNIVFVAENHNSHPIGLVEASLREYVDGCQTSPVAYIEGIYVIEAYRKQGIARRLVAAVERWGTTNQCLEMASDTELSNYLGQQVHRQLGFEEVARIIVFRKQIGS